MAYQGTEKRAEEAIRRRVERMVDIVEEEEEEDCGDDDDDGVAWRWSARRIWSAAMRWEALGKGGSHASGL